MEFSPLSLSLYALLVIGSCSATPKDRVSHPKHYKEGVHNTDYDHEAFLGKDGMKEFEDLTPQKSQERLGKIFDKIDEDNDGFVELPEMHKWVETVHANWLDKVSQEEWNGTNPNGTDKVSWDMYRRYAYALDHEDDITEESLIEQEEAFKKIIAREKRRWAAIDQDEDGLLNKTEFSEFTHPEESRNLADLVALETLEDLDKDGDNLISLEEFVQDLYIHQTGEFEPEWVTEERRLFKRRHDKNQDGFLDKEEVKAWMSPEGYMHAEAEAKHLIYGADLNNDKKLSKREVLDNSDLFVASKATEYGDFLTNEHDEL